MIARFILPLIMLFSSCSVLSHSSRSLVVKGYERCGKCTQESVENAIEKISRVGGGILKLKKNGIYVIRPQFEYIFQLPSNITIEGNGAKFIIADGSNTDAFTWDALFYAENKNNINIKNLTLTSNGKNSPVLKIVSLQGAHYHNGLLSAMRTNNILLSNCTVQDVKGYGAVFLAYCDNVTIRGCKFFDIGVEKSNSIIGDASVIMGVGDNWLITENFLKNSYLSNCGTGLDLACANSVVKDNTVISFWAGANLANNGVNESHNVKLENNLFQDNATGLYLWASEKPYKGGCHHNTIKDNRFVWTTKKGWSVRGIDMGFFVYGEVNNIIIEGNDFVALSNGSTPTDSYEIALRIGPVEKTYSGSINQWGSVKYINIINNKIEGCTGAAVQIERRANQISVNDNIVQDVSTGTMSYSTKRAFVVTDLSTKVSPRHISFENNTVTNNREEVKHPVFVKDADVKVNGVITK